MGDRTALHFGFLEGNVEIVKLLISRDDVDVNVKDKWGKTAFHYVCIKREQFQQEDKILIGAQICAKHELHPSELEDEMEEELIMQISNALSQRKSARN